MSGIDSISAFHTVHYMIQHSMYSILARTINISIAIKYSAPFINIINK